MILKHINSARTSTQFAYSIKLKIMLHSSNASSFFIFVLLLGDSFFHLHIMIIMVIIYWLWTGSFHHLEIVALILERRMRGLLICSTLPIVLDLLCLENDFSLSFMYCKRSFFYCKSIWGDHLLWSGACIHGTVVSSSQKISLAARFG
jgi:hypothetical protein